MAGGQALDLGFMGDEAQITPIHRLKTAELIRASLEAGTIVANRPDLRDRVGRSALAIGLAFQLADDLLDVEGDPNLVGKKLRKDEGNHSPNAVLFRGREAVVRDMDSLYRQALAELEACRLDSPELQALYHMMVYRTA